jgi:hypothetical protein
VSARQWFSYDLALAKGTNPDTCYLDDPRHQQAEMRDTL